MEQQRLAGLTLTALGVVYGDIGTSPLYTLREAFGATGGLALQPSAILGVLSLIFWSLVVVVSFKYINLIMRAGNRGEGGVLALATLAGRGLRNTRRERLAVGLAMVGAALFYGDGLVTPAISVLSAVEGLHIVTPLLDRAAPPVAAAILVVLFLLQSHGTGRVGRWFGPVIFVWFVVMGLLGVLSILDNPAVLQALWPSHAVWFFVEYKLQGFIALGAVVLAVTGCEALYADMGHVGRTPIRIAWFFLVLPGLVLNYFGQGALLLRDPGALANPFFLMAPSWALLPMVILATCATIIASQAVISGAFSLTRQAVQLGYLPRMVIRHTSESEAGQVYVPRANWMMMVAIIALVAMFQSSGALAAAYGIAVTGTMTITVVLAYLVARFVWNWPRLPCLVLFGSLLLMDLAFFAANVVKIGSGGWFPLVLAGLVYVIISTWRRGREALVRRLHHNAVPLADFVAFIPERDYYRIPGNAVFLTGREGVVPRALLHNLKHNHVLHRRIIIVTVQPAEVPVVRDARRVRVRDWGQEVHTVLLRYGFMERPHVPGMLMATGLVDMQAGLLDTSFFLSRESLIPSDEPDLPPWREHLFIFLNQNSLSATEFFGLPPNRVVELGTQLRI